MGEVRSGLQTVPELEKVTRTKTELRVIAQSIYSGRIDQESSNFDELFGINRSEKEISRVELGQKRDEWIRSVVIGEMEFNEKELSFLKRSLVARDRFDKLQLTRNEKGQFVKNETKKEFVAPRMEFDISDEDVTLVMERIGRNGDKKIKNKLLKKVLFGVSTLMLSCGAITGTVYANFSEQINSLVSLVNMLRIGSDMHESIEIEFSDEALLEVTNALGAEEPFVQVFGENENIDPNEGGEEENDWQDVGVVNKDVVQESDRLEDSSEEAEATEVPIRPDEEVGEFNTGMYSVLIDSTIDGLIALRDNMSASDPDNPQRTQLDEMIERYEAKKENNEPFVINFIMHDNFRYGTAGDDRAYWGEGSEHQGSADGVFQVRFFPDGRIGVVSFGRDLNTGIPVIGEDGEFTMDFETSSGRKHTVEELNGVMALSGGGFVRNSDRSVRTYMENGGQDFWFEENTGIDGDLNIIASLEVGFDVMNSMYPDGVSLVSPFDLDVESSDLTTVGGDIHMRTGEPVKLTAQQFFYLLRARDISLGGDYVGTEDRGFAVVKAILGDDDRARAMGNIANLIPSSSNLVGAMGALFGRGSGDRRVIATDTESQVLMVIFSEIYRTNPELLASSFIYGLVNGATNTYSNGLIPVQMVNVSYGNNISEVDRQGYVVSQIDGAFDVQKNED